jgi:hypothetical protein
VRARFWLRGRTLAIVGLAAVALHCRPRSVTPTSSASAAPDSITAVRMAMGAYWGAWQPPHPFELRVYEFVRDSAGYLITLVPTPESRVEGGGGRVRVTKAGDVRVVSRFQ